MSPTDETGGWTLGYKNQGEEPGLRDWNSKGKRSIPPPPPPPLHAAHMSNGDCLMAKNCFSPWRCPRERKRSSEVEESIFHPVEKTAVDNDNTLPRIGEDNGEGLEGEEKINCSPHYSRIAEWRVFLPPLPPPPPHIIVAQAITHA